MGKITFCDIFELLKSNQSSSPKQLDFYEMFEDLQIQKDQNLYLLDLFPCTITDANKYAQVEISFQKMIDRDITKQKFELTEKKFQNLFELLWLYNATYSSVEPINLKKNFPAKKSKQVIKNYLKAQNNTTQLQEVKSKDVLSSIVSIACREIETTYLFFVEAQIVTLHHQMSSLVYFCNPGEKEKFIKIANKFGLYCRLYSDT